LHGRLSYNSADFIQSNIESVYDQSYSEIEQIIIDGVSSDLTSEIIQKINNRVDIFISESDNGIYDAMNKGINHATGEVIGFLNADDMLYDEKVLERIAESFKDDSVDAVYGDLVYVKRNEINHISRIWHSKDYQKEIFKKGWHPPHPTFYVRKKIYDKYGVFNLKYKIAADYELMLRFIHKYQIKVKYLPKMLIKMRLGGTSNISIKNILRANYECMQSWKDNGFSPPYFGLIRKPFSKIFQYY